MMPPPRRLSSAGDHIRVPKAPLLSDPNWGFYERRRLLQILGHTLVAGVDRMSYIKHDSIPNPINVNMDSARRSKHGVREEKVQEICKPCSYRARL